LETKHKKLEFERQKKKAHETDGCTFEPKINKSKPKLNQSKMSSRTNISMGSQSNRSYSSIHRNRTPKPHSHSFAPNRTHSARKPAPAATATLRIDNSTNGQLAHLAK
jgi:hypothetical protein